MIDVQWVCINKMRTDSQGSWHVDNRDGTHALIPREEWESLTSEHQHMESVLNRLHAIGGIVAYSEGEWLPISEAAVGQ